MSKYVIKKIAEKIKFSLCFVFALVSVGACEVKKDESVWVVGTSADNPPYEYIENGELVGFDIDLINAIGDHLGKKIEFKNMDFHGILASLTTGGVDLAIAGISITSERKQRIDFSVPYTSANIAILFRTSSEITKLEDLKGKVVGAQLGTIWSVVAHQMANKYKNNVTALYSNLMLVEELKTKRIDALVMEVSQAEQFASKNENLGFMKLDEYASTFAIAVPKDSAIKNNIDHTIKALRNNGTIKQLEQKWGIAE